MNHAFPLLIKSLLRQMPLLAIFLWPLVATALSPAKEVAPAVNLKALVFHDCKGECEAKKALKQLRPFKLPAAQKEMKNPLGVEVCQDQLGGQFTFLKLGGKERGVCSFKDNSKVELHGLHMESEKFVQP